PYGHQHARDARRSRALRAGVRRAVRRCWLQARTRGPHRGAVQRRRGHAGLTARRDGGGVVHRFGQRSEFAIEIGPVISGHATTGLRVVDLWSAGRELCCDDHHASVPQFCMSVERTLERWEPSYALLLPWPDLPPEQNHRRLYAGTYNERAG